MKGSQGLDALAALCGGAPMAVEGASPRSINMPIAPATSRLPTNMNGAVQATVPTTQNQHISASQASNSRPHQQIHQAWQNQMAGNIPSVRGGVTTQATTSANVTTQDPMSAAAALLSAVYQQQQGTNASNNAVQQLASQMQGHYQAYYQAQAVQFAQQFTQPQPQNCFSNPSGNGMVLDNAAAAAMFSAITQHSQGNTFGNQPVVTQAPCSTQAPQVLAVAQPQPLPQEQCLQHNLQQTVPHLHPQQQQINRQVSMPPPPSVSQQEESLLKQVSIAPALSPHSTVQNQPNKQSDMPPPVIHQELSVNSSFPIASNQVTKGGKVLTQQKPPLNSRQVALSLPQIQPQPSHRNQASVLPTGQRSNLSISPYPQLPCTDASTTVSVSSSSSSRHDEIENAENSIECIMNDPNLSLEDKKQLKRAANRRSAQLSRKRKKQFIEELKDENDDLRRKEQILRSIPDLIVVFDSSGKLSFVSHSVTNSLNFTPSELENTSFWDRLCDESVRLLKAAFMDALAARVKGMHTAPLGTSLWELRLVDKDMTFKLVTLNGVVHFGDEKSNSTSECVCSIRPLDEDDGSSKKHKSSGNVMFKPPSTSIHQLSPSVRNMIKPQQSVFGSASSRSAAVSLSDEGASAVSSSSSIGSNGISRQRQQGGRLSNGVAKMISDGESVVSESGSDES
mmetsp:Transcript_21641/g.24827  ORF Transcript_21641/g.24827 Transcript_21641/m.24827 type:complete len:679 (+) Transcript_21641:50-2086(+)